MELLGQQLISADRQTVWAALNDPEILVQCIPGCEEITRVSENQLQVRLMVKMGPVRSRFAGTLTLEDIVPPESCSLVFEGTGAAGFAKGGAQVVLTSQGAQTHLDYTAKASVGGKLGQIGGRLIESSARKMSDEFFSAFQSVLSKEAEPGIVAESTVAVSPAQDAKLASAGRTAGAENASGETAQPQVPASRATAAHKAAGLPRNNVTTGVGEGWRPELYRAFWFCLGVFFTLLVGHWLP
ncbi:carbon monoxide dehydrogenase subunit G [Pusillimonas sp.]|uniref:carbon monoxide dehydrogenase subunit G n=1 Tax=Pusillimonas sp. TaxID=3040095 RepID=UPI0037C7BC4F